MERFEHFTRTVQFDMGVKVSILDPFQFSYKFFSIMYVLEIIAGPCVNKHMPTTQPVSQC